MPSFVGHWSGFDASEADGFGMQHSAAQEIFDDSLLVGRKILASTIMVVLSLVCQERMVSRVAEEIVFR